MKRNDFKKLFDYVDKSENTSVEFQSVWRKTHRRNWVKRLFQSSLHNVAILLTLLILTPVLGHFVMNQNLNSESSDLLSEHSNFYISGNVYNLPNLVLIKGLSNLPLDTVVTIEKIAREDNTVVLEEEITIDAEGSFQFVTERLEKDREYLLNVSIYSHNQTQRVKGIMGENGERLESFTSANGIFQYRKNNENFYGLRLMGVAYKVDDNKYHLLPKYLMDIKEFEAAGVKKSY